MSEFKTGDRITVADSLTPEQPRYFLAELDGWAYYRTGDGSVGNRGAWGTAPSNVSAYVPPAPPFPFKVGDRIRKSGDSMLRDVVYTVMAVTGDDVYLAYFKYGKVNPASGRVTDSWESWERVSDTDTAKPPALRDRSGCVWRPTGRRSDSGEAYYSSVGNVDNKTTRAKLINAGYGPLTEVVDA